MMHPIKNILTGKDNQTFDLGRVVGLASVIMYNILEFMKIWRDPLKFDEQSYGIGLGAIIGSVGLHLYLKKETEPDGTEKETKIEEK